MKCRATKGLGLFLAGILLASLPVFLFSVLLGASPLWAGTFTLFGPQNYVRGTGSPVAEVKSFPALNPATTYTLKIFNGGLQDADFERVSSSVISLNGAQIVGPSEFNQNVSYIEKQITLQSSNELSVELRGKPGGGITILIDGIDNTAPQILINAPANGLISSNSRPSLSVQFSDSLSGINPSSFRALLNGVDRTADFSVTAAGAGFTPPGLSDAVYRFQATVQDRAGNSNSAEVSFQIDAVPPVSSAALSRLPNPAGWNNSDLVVHLGAQDPAVGTGVKEIHYRINGGTETVVAGAAVDLSFNQEGVSTLSYFAVDLAGNREGERQQVVRLDKTPPSLTDILSPAPNAAGWLQSDVTVTFSATDSLSTVASVTPPVTLTTEGAGQVVTGEAVDVAGNRATRSVSLNIDKTKPTLAIGSPADGAILGTSSSPLSLSFSDGLFAIPAGGLSVTLNGNDLTPSFTPTAGGASFTPAALADGAYTLIARVTDQAGNSTAAQVHFTVDTIPPALRVDAPPPSAAAATGTITVRGQATDATTSLASLTVNGAAVSVAADGSFTAEAPLNAEGSNPVEITATDAAGNIARAGLTVVRDTTPPLVEITRPAEGAYTNAATILVEGTVSDQTTSVASVTVNGVAASIANGLFQATVPLQEGSNPVAVAAADAVGNVRSLSLNLTRDSLPPLITLTAPENGAFLALSPESVTGSITDASPITAVTLNGNAVVLTGGSFSQSVDLIAGTNSFTLSATDAAGNVGTILLQVTLDNIPPEIVVTAPADDLVTRTSPVTITGRITDTGALRESFLNGAPLSLTTGAFLVDFPLVEGPNPITLSARDAGGNLAERRLTVTLDTVAPAVTITFPADQAALNQKLVTVSGTINDPTATITVNGVAAEISSGLYSVAGISLSPGRNDLTIRAVDAVGNETTQTRTVFVDDIPPVVQISAPAAGAILSQATVTVTGTIDDPAATVSVNGVAAVVSGDQFTAAGVPAPEGALVLRVRAEDPAGNLGSDERTVTIDRTPPTVTLTAPSEAAAGENVAIHLEGTDNLAVESIELSIGGQPVAGFDTPSADFTYTVPPTTPVGTLLSLLGRAVDSAGLTQGQGGSVLVNAPARTPGFAQGRVLDDRVGLPLAGAAVTLDSETKVADADGAYLFNRPAGPLLLFFAMAGYTEVERIGEIPAGQKATLLDARLTPIDSKENRIGSAGGRGFNEAGSLFLDIPAGALASEVSLHLTEVSNQGLINRLPLGWSPIAAVQLDCGSQNADCGGRINGVLTVPNRFALTAGTMIDAARYDRTAHAWRVIPSGQVAADGKTITLSAPQAGQYALLLADAGETAPPAPIVDALLEGFSGAPLPNPILSVSGSVVPKAAVSGGPIHAVGEVILSPAQPLPSGLRLAAKVAEQFDLRDLSQRQSGFTQDLLVYHWSFSSASPLPPPLSRLSTQFPVTPSRSYTLTELALGKVTLDFSLPPEARVGTLIGSAGGTLSAPDGLLVSIPSGALASDTLARVEGQATGSLSLPAGWMLVRSVLLDLTQATLSQSATLSLPAPANLAAGRPVVIGRVIDIQGERGLKWVAFGKISGSLLVSTPTLFGITLSGIRQEGEYLILQPTGDIGFVNGVVSALPGGPQLGVKVKSPESPFLDLTAADGIYHLPLFTGGRAVTAEDLASPRQATQAVTLAANQAVTQNLALAEVPFAVVLVSPADGAQIVPLDSPIVVQFNRAVLGTSLTAASVQLMEGTAPVEALLVRSASGVSLYPRELKSKTVYTLTLSTGVTDLFGKPLPAAVTASFTTKSTVPPAIPPAGQITVSFPDEAGFVTISATQGTIATENHLDLFNATTGLTVSVDLRGDGSFTGKIQADLGDELQLVIRDPSGNVTLADPGPSQNGNGTTFVGIKGGLLRAPGLNSGEEITLAVSPGSFPSPIEVTITPVAESLLPLPVPEQLLFGGAAQIDTRGHSFSKPGKLSLPLPDNLPSGAVPFLVKIDEIKGEKTYVIVDSAKAENGRVHTASYPFPGLTEPGIFGFFFVPPQIIPVVIDGNIFKDKDGNGLLDFNDANANGRVDPSETISDLPVPNAIVEARAPFLGTAPRMVAKSDAQGHYAIVALVMPTASTASSVDVTLKATDPLTLVSKEIALTQPATAYSSGAVFHANILLSDLTRQLASDLTPPQVTLSVQGEKYISGVALVGTPVTISVTATDDTEVDPRTLSLTVNDAPLPYTSPAPPNRNPFTATFLPNESGYYVVNAAVRDLSGKLGGTVFSFQALQPNQIPQPQSGAPKIIDGSLYPADGAQDVAVNATFQFLFNEPVSNADSTTITLKERDSGNAVPVDVRSLLISGGMLMQVTPQRNLKFSAIDPLTRAYAPTFYQLVIHKEIQDLDTPQPNALGQDVTVTFATSALVPSPPFNPLKKPGIEARLGDTLYITDVNDDGTAAIRIIDISDPDAPQFVTSLSITNGRAYGIAVSDDYAYTELGVNAIMAVATYNPMTGFGVLQAFSLNNPRDPQPLRGGILTQDFAGVPFRVQIAGKFAYVATLLQGIQVVDLEKVISQTRKLTDPVVVGGVSEDQLGGSPLALQLVGGKTYVLSRNQLTVFNGSPVSFLTPARQISLPNVAKQMEIVPGDRFLDRSGVEHTKDLAFITTAPDRLEIIDLTEGEDLTNPPLPYAYRLGDNTSTLKAMPGQNLLAVTVGYDLVLLDLKRPLTPERIELPDKPLVLARVQGAAVSSHVVNEKQTHFAAVATTVGGHTLKVIQGGTILFKEIQSGKENEMRGVVTDGATRVRVELNGFAPAGVIDGSIINLELKERGHPEWTGGFCKTINVAASCAADHITVRVKKLGDRIVTDTTDPVYYQGPPTFARFGNSDEEEKDKNLPERGVSMTFRTTAFPIIEIARKEVVLQRPPVLLVHGTWGNTGTWDFFEPLLNHKKLFTIMRADYSQGVYQGKQFSNVGSLDDNYLVMELYIRELKREILAKGLAVTKVDVIAHSLGGLVTRKYCAMQLTDCREQIHKLITIDTPHLGTEVANLLEDKKQRDDLWVSLALLMEKKLKITFYGPALREQAVKGPALQDLERIEREASGLAANDPRRVTLIPMHMVVGQTPDGLNEYSPMFKVMWNGLKRFYGLVPDQTFPHFEIVYELGQPQIRPLTTVFGNLDSEGGVDSEQGRNDRLVALYSQRFLLYNQAVSFFENVDHITAHDEQNPINGVNGVKSILEAPITDSLFVLP